jgi:hypothetical protein
MAGRQLCANFCREEVQQVAAYSITLSGSVKKRHRLRPRPRHLSAGQEPSTASKAELQAYCTRTIGAGFHVPFSAAAFGQ